MKAGLAYLPRKCPAHAAGIVYLPPLVYPNGLVVTARLTYDLSWLMFGPASIFKERGLCSA